MISSPPSYFVDTVDMVRIVENEEGYFLALGRFVHTYSTVEGLISAYLAKVAGVSDEIANAVFSGVKIRTAMDNIRRAHEAKRTDVDPAFAGVAPQIGLIASVRDFILHNGVVFSGGKPSHSTNERRVHTPEKAQIVRVSVEILNAMTSDLDEIKRRLHAAIWRGHIDDEMHHMMFGDLGPPSWLYKHQQRAGNPARSPKKSRGRSNRPKSSPA